MKSYRHIFFDLDHTLWDFEKNSEETLEELYHLHRLQHAGADGSAAFKLIYKEKNDIAWMQFSRGEIDRGTLRYRRFEDTLQELGIPDRGLAVRLAHDYLAILPGKKHLMPHAHEILGYLQEQYHLHIITNGFEEVQMKKIRNTRLSGYFRNIITSEKAGARKPERAIFSHALEKAGGAVQESIFIGDDWDADITGARNAGLDQIFFNPEKKNRPDEVTFEISCLSELKNIL